MAVGAGVVVDYVAGYGVVYSAAFGAGGAGEGLGGGG